MVNLNDARGKLNNAHGKINRRKLKIVRFGKLDIKKKLENMADPEWDLSDFMAKYTTNSNQIFSSPSKTEHNDLFDRSMESDSAPSPSKIEKLNTSLGDEFCTQQNLQERLNYLNQELAMFGFDSIFVHSRNGKSHSKLVEDLDLAKLVNCTYELSRRQHIQAKIKDDLEERQMRSETDNEYLLQNQVRLKQDLENLKRESALLLCREKEQIGKCRILTQDLKNERDEKRLLKSDVEHLKKQFYHESKRTEKEIGRLKEKVHQLLNDKSIDKKIGIDVLNSLQRADGKRSTWNRTGKRNEEEMYILVISNYEDKEKKILSENQALRETICKVQNMLVSIDSSMYNEITDDDNKQLQMPYTMVKNDVEAKIHFMVSSVKEKLDTRLQSKTDYKDSPSQASNNSSYTSKQPDSEEPSNQLQQCKIIITGQEAIIQGLREGYSKEAFERALLKFGISEENYEEAEKQLKTLKEEERKFNEERKNFTEYVLKISKEREEFEKERVEFYMHCLSTPVMKKDKKLHPKTGYTKGNLRMGTQAFSPAPQQQQQLQRRLSNKNLNTKTPPSTAELYKFMSLTYDGAVARNLEKNLDGSFIRSADNSPSPKKLQEHADNIRKVVESRHGKSLEEEKSRNHADNDGPLYMME